LAGGLLARWQGTDRSGRRRWLARGAFGLLVAAMAVQALAVPPYVRTRRTLPPQVVAGFDWIRTSTPPHARFLYLEVNMLALTGRPVIWASVVPQYLFNASDERQIQMLYYLHTDYIAIHPTRLCDTSSRQVVPTAYPRPWVRSLAGKRYLTLVYPPGGPAEEGEFLVYRIDYDKVPPAWLVGNEPTWFKGGG
jgi:hypothetical protein